MGDEKNNKRGILLILIGYVILIGIALFDIKRSGGHFDWVSICSSLLIFGGFSSINISMDLDKLSSKTLYVYLIHAFVWNLLSRIVRKIGPSVDAAFMIPIFVFGVTILSYLLAEIYLKLWDYVDGKYKINDKICKSLKLE